MCSGDELQKKLGIDTDPDNIAGKIQPDAKGERFPIYSIRNYLLRVQLSPLE